MPSSADGEATIRVIDEDYDVVMWKTRRIRVDTDIMNADQVDVFNKAAQIYIASRNMGFEPDGMSLSKCRNFPTLGLPKKAGEVSH